MFSPSADEVAQARKMIAAFDLPENKDKGVVQMDGRMVERMHAEMARRGWRLRTPSRRGSSYRSGAARAVCSLPRIARRRRA